MEPTDQHPRDYDVYDPEVEDGIDLFYVERLSLVQAGARVFLVDGASSGEIVEEMRRMAPDEPEIAFTTLDRSRAARFAYYMDWDVVVNALPNDHPIARMPIPYLPTTELEPADARLSEIDLDALRAGFQATQADTSGGRFGRDASGR